MLTARPSHPAKTQPLHQLLHLVLTSPNKRKRNRIPSRQHHQRRLPHHPRPYILLEIPPHHCLSPHHKLVRLLHHLKPLRLRHLRPPDRNTAPPPSAPDKPTHSPPQSESKHSLPRPEPPAAAKTPPATLGLPCQHLSCAFLSLSIHLLGPQHPPSRNLARESKCRIPVQTSTHRPRIDLRSRARRGFLNLLRRGRRRACRLTCLRSSRNRRTSRDPEHRNPEKSDHRRHRYTAACRVVHASILQGHFTTLLSRNFASRRSALKEKGRPARPPN